MGTAHEVNIRRVDPNDLTLPVPGLPCKGILVTLKKEGETNTEWVFIGDPVNPEDSL